MKKTTIRLDDTSDRNIDALRRLFDTTRQDAILLSISFLVTAMKAKSGDSIELPDGTEFTVEYP